MVGWLWLAPFILAFTPTAIFLYQRGTQSAFIEVHTLSHSFAQMMHCTSLMFRGVFDRFPNLKLGLLHGGGYIPYHLGRLDQGKIGASGSSAIPAKLPPSKYLKNLYFDNLVYRVETVEYLKRMVGADHIMVGTDYPFDLGDWRAAEKIQKMECTSAEREAMLHGNARRLLRIG